MALLKTRCYMALKKPAATWQYFCKILQSPNIILAPNFTKPKWYFGTYFCKAQILFWHLISQSPNDILTPIFTKPKYYFGTKFIKPKYYFGTHLTNPNIILALVLLILKSLTHGKYNYSSIKKYLSYKIYKSSCISSMTKLFIFVVMTKPKEAQLQSLAKPTQLTYKSQQLKLTWAIQSSFSTTW